MKKILKEIQIVEKEVFQYETDDGELFDQEYKALDHEYKYYAEKGIKNVRSKNTMCYDGEIFGMEYDRWYFIESEEQLNDIVNYYKYTWDKNASLNRHGCKTNSHDVVGDWLGVSLYYSGDYEDVYFTTLSEIKKEYDEIGELIKQIESD